MERLINKPIYTQRLLLRDFRYEDVSDVVRICNHERIFINTEHLPYPYLEKHAYEWLEKQKSEKKVICLAICELKTMKLIGCLSLTNEKYNSGEIGYWLDEDFEGRGFCTEAVKKLISIAFASLDYHRVYARCFSTNQKSIHVLRNSGFQYEGTLKHACYKKGEYRDVLMFSIINNK